MVGVGVSNNANNAVNANNANNVYGVSGSYAFKIIIQILINILIYGIETLLI